MFCHKFFFKTSTEHEKKSKKYFLTNLIKLKVLSDTKNLNSSNQHLPSSSTALGEVEASQLYPNLTGELKISEIHTDLVDFSNSSRKMSEDMETTTIRQPTKRSHSMGRLNPTNDQQSKRTTRRSTQKMKPSPNNNNDDEKLQINIPTHNEFEALNDEMLIDNEESPVSTGSSNGNFRPALNPSKKSKERNESRKPKPIIVTKYTHQAIQELLSHLKIKASLKKLNGPSSFKIFAESPGDKKSILNNLKVKAIPHHTYCEPEDRHWNFVLKGHHQSDPAEVLKELQEDEIPATKVAMISKSIDNPINLVFFEKDNITLNELLHKHRTINNLRVS